MKILLKILTTNVMHFKVLIIRAIMSSNEQIRNLHQSVVRGDPSGISRIYYISLSKCERPIICYALKTKKQGVY